MSRDTEGAPAARRTFLGWLMKGFLSLWAVGAAAMGVMFLRAPDSERRPGERTIKCGPIGSLPVGEARFIRHGTEPLFVVRASDSEVVALSAVCSHLRCVLRFNEASKTILCPCHAGAFDREGNVLSGPPRRPLNRYAAEVRAGEIIVRL